jgi:L-fucose isomerase-like protein
MTAVKDQLTYGLLIGNRGFFPAHLCESARAVLLKIFANREEQIVTLSDQATQFGSIESVQDARLAADQLRAHRDQIDGIIVSLPNFGDERAVANTLRWAELDVPVLIHAFPEATGKMGLSDRRDSYCGKISLCNNLRQYGVKFTLTNEHVVDPESQSFQSDLDRFAGICRVVGALKHLRLGVIGARPAAFNTVRFSEKLLERSGISVETIDLSEIIHRATNLDDQEPGLDEKITEIESYLADNRTPPEAMLRMAKLGLVIDRWMDDQQLAASAVQCWTALEEIYGVVPCTLMSMMSDRLLPSACETDIMGAVSMLALSAAANAPAAIVDFNNNYQDQQDKCVLFHCSNFPRELLNLEPSGSLPGSLITYHDILSEGLGKDRSWGIIAGRLAAGPYTYCRISSDDLNGSIKAYAGQGSMTDDPLDTFGGFGVFEIPDLNGLMQFICRNGFEHHVSIALDHTASVLEEAFRNYLNWETYLHSGE